MAYVTPTVGEHAVCFPSKVLAGNMGAHIFDVKLTTAADNGNIISRTKGAWVDGSFENYAEAACPEGFTAKVVSQAKNGNWYVEVLTVPTTSEALLVYNSPIIPYESPASLADLHNFYNAAGEIVKAYVLTVGDIFEVSEEAFTGTPTKGASLTVGSKKLVVGS